MGKRLWLKHICFIIGLMQLLVLVGLRFLKLILWILSEFIAAVFIMRISITIRPAEFRRFFLDTFRTRLTHGGRIMKRHFALLFAGLLALAGCSGESVSSIPDPSFCFENSVQVRIEGATTSDCVFVSEPTRQAHLDTSAAKYYSADLTSSESFPFVKGETYSIYYETYFATYSETLYVLCIFD